MVLNFTLLLMCSKGYVIMQKQSIQCKNAVFCPLKPTPFLKHHITHCIKLRNPISHCLFLNRCMIPYPLQTTITSILLQRKIFIGYSKLPPPLITLEQRSFSCPRLIADVAHQQKSSIMQAGRKKVLQEHWLLIVVIIMRQNSARNADTFHMCALAFHLTRERLSTGVMFQKFSEASKNGMWRSQFL